MTAEALSRPVCTATVGEKDTVTVTVDGIGQEFQSMAEAISYLAGTADDLGRPLKVTALDPSSNQPAARLIISSDGSVAEEPASRARKRSSARRTTAEAPSPEQLSPPAHEPGPAQAAAEQGPTAPRATTDDVARSPETNTEPANTAVAGAGPLVPVPVPVPERSTAAGDRTAWVPGKDSGGADASQRLRREGNAQKSPFAAREGWRARFNAIFKTRLAPSQQERARRERRNRIQRPLEAHRTVATVQLKGGGTKTTLTYYLAATYGRIRGGNILAGEVNENQGTLAERSMPAPHERSTLDLIRNLTTVSLHTSDLVRYVRPQGDDRIHVLASPPEGADRRRVDGTSVKAAHEVLRSLYNLILLDTGNSAQASTWRAAVAAADALVLVTQNKEDDSRLLEATVEAVRAEGQGTKLFRSILVITNTAHPNEERIGRLREYAKTIGLAATVIVPFDPSLQEGQAFDYDALAPATRRAYEEATAALTDQL